MAAVLTRGAGCCNLKGNNISKCDDREKVFLIATESCRMLRGNAMRKNVTGPGAVSLRRRRRLGENGFPHRYQRGSIRPTGPMVKADRICQVEWYRGSVGFRLFKCEGDGGFFCCLIWDDEDIVPYGSGWQPGPLSAPPGHLLPGEGKNDFMNEKYRRTRHEAHQNF